MSDRFTLAASPRVPLALPSVRGLRVPALRAGVLLLAAFAVAAVLALSGGVGPAVGTLGVLAVFAGVIASLVVVPLAVVRVGVALTR